MVRGQRGERVEQHAVALRQRAQAVRVLDPGRFRRADQGAHHPAGGSRPGHRGGPLDRCGVGLGVAADRGEAERRHRQRGPGAGAQPAGGQGGVRQRGGVAGDEGQRVVRPEAPAGRSAGERSCSASAVLASAESSAVPMPTCSRTTGSASALIMRGECGDHAGAQSGPAGAELVEPDQQHGPHPVGRARPPAGGGVAAQQALGAAVSGSTSTCGWRRPRWTGRRSAAAGRRAPPAGASGPPGRWPCESPRRPAGRRRRSAICAVDRCCPSIRIIGGTSRQKSDRSICGQRRSARVLSADSCHNAGFTLWVPGNQPPTPRDQQD